MRLAHMASSPMTIVSTMINPERRKICEGLEQRYRLS